MLGEADLKALIKDELWPSWRAERERLDLIDAWSRWRQEPIQLPRKATPEHKQLAELSRTPWLGLVVTTVAQCMYVDGVHFAADAGTVPDPGPDGVLQVEEIDGPWRTWQANRMDSRQIAIHRATLTYGQSFVTVLPGENRRGRPTSVMRGVSPRKMFALWDDPAADDWPRYAMQIIREGKPYRVRVYDDEVVHVLDVEEDTIDGIKLVEQFAHDSGVCPVVRHANQLDLDGRSPGEVEPYIPAAKRINKTAYDRLLVQHFSSWRVRTIAGMSEPDSEEEAARKKLELKVEDLLVAEDPDTKFGTLEATPVEGFISAWRADIEALAAVTQTPTHALTGQLVNLSAEALAAARAALTQKVHERQKSEGEAHLQGLQLAALQQGEFDYADDVSARVTWQDMEIRSMSQAVDALGKAATMLAIPPEVLWSRIPGVEKSDVDEWKRLAEQADPVARYSAELARQAAGDQAVRRAVRDTTTSVA